IGAGRIWRGTCFVSAHEPRPGPGVRTMKGITRTLCGAIAGLAAVATVAAAEVVTLSDASGGETARRANELCSRAASERSRERAFATLDRALELAEQAVAEDPKDAKAHFAVFCSLGRRAEIDGGGIGDLPNLGRIRDA